MGQELTALCSSETPQAELTISNVIFFKATTLLPGTFFLLFFLSKKWSSSLQKAINPLLSLVFLESAFLWAKAVRCSLTNYIKILRAANKPLTPLARSSLDAKLQNYRRETYVRAGEAGTPHMLMATSAFRGMNSFLSASHSSCANFAQYNFTQNLTHPRILISYK